MKTEGDATYADMQDDNMIDDNINRALRALKSPRLSIPQSNEKESKRDSSRSRIREGNEEIETHGLDERRNSGMKLSTLKSYPNNPFERHRSVSRGRRSRSISQNSRQSKNEVNETQELREFLEIEKSCQESDPPSSALSGLASPYKDLSKVKSKSSKRIPDKREEERVAPFELDRPESRNQDGKRGFNTKTEPSGTSFRTKGSKAGKRSAERVTFKDPIIVSDFGKTPKITQVWNIFVDIFIGTTRFQL